MLDRNALVTDGAKACPGGRKSR